MCLILNNKSIKLNVYTFYSKNVPDSVYNIGRQVVLFNLYFVKYFIYSAL